MLATSLLFISLRCDISPITLHYTEMHKRRAVKLLPKQKSPWNFFLLLESTHAHTQTCMWLMGKKCTPLSEAWTLYPSHFNYMESALVASSSSTSFVAFLLPGSLIQPGNLGSVAWSCLSPNEISWLPLILSLKMWVNCGISLAPILFQWEKDC